GRPNPKSRSPCPRRRAFHQRVHHLPILHSCPVFTPDRPLSLNQRRRWVQRKAHLLADPSPVAHEGGIYHHPRGAEHAPGSRERALRLSERNPRFHVRQRRSVRHFPEKRGCGKWWDSKAVRKPRCYRERLAGKTVAAVR